MPWLGYVRVSRVGDRAERLISPDLQAERIKAYARSHGLEVALLDPELDVSGAKTERPILGQAIEHIERGEAAGIIVAQLDRLSRAGIVATHHLIQRIESLGGKVIAVAESFDDSTPEGRMGRNVMLALGEMQLDRYRAQFAAAKESAVRRGIWPMPIPPRGYSIGPDRKLRPNREAKLIVRAFDARAAGASWRQVAQVLGRGLSGASKTVHNRVYLGELRLGTLQNLSAHPAIVDRALWEAAQIAHPRPARGIHGPGLLSGLVRCASCGYAMSRNTGSRGWQGYRCHPRKARNLCGAPALISERLLHPFVEAVVLHHLEGLSYAPDDSQAVSEATKELEAAEAELAAYQSAQSVSGLGEEHFVAGMKSRVAVVESGRRKLAETRSVVSLPSEGFVIEAYPTWPVDARRHFLRRLLSAVVVSRGRGEVAGRTRILDNEGAPVEVPKDLRRRFGGV